MGKARRTRVEIKGREAARNVNLKGGSTLFPERAGVGINVDPGKKRRLRELEGGVNENVTRETGGHGGT